MGVIKEFRCLAHGPFESTDKCCPYGCGTAMVVQEIRTAPAYRGAKTGFIDRELKATAQSLGLSDMKCDPKSGTSMMQQLRKGEFAVDQSRGYAKSMNLQVPHAAAGWSARGESAPKFDAAAAGFASAGVNALKGLPKPRPQVVARYRK